MKKIISLLFWLSTVTISSQSNIIDNPHYLFRNDAVNTISRIELHDTITKVHMHVTFVPKWWIQFTAMNFIQPIGTNHRYHLIGLEGGTMDKRMSTRTGEADYVLLFNPIEKSVKEIHYGSIYNDKAEISIYNVSLEHSFDSIRYEETRAMPDSIAKRIDSKLAEARNVKELDFDSDTFFDNRPASLVGFIKGYMAENVVTLPVKYQLATGLAVGMPLKIYPDGYFEADFYGLDYPRMLSFSILGTDNITFYIEPGHTLAMILDWEDILQGNRFRDRVYILPNTEFDGVLAQVNSDLTKRYLFKPHNFELERRLENLTPEEHKTDIEARIKEGLAILDETDKLTKPLCPKAKRLIANEVKASALSELLQFSQKYTSREKNKQEPPLTYNYYSLLNQQLPSNDRSILSVLASDELQNRLIMAGIFSRPYNMYSPEFNPEESFVEYLTKSGIEVSEDSEKLLSIFQKSLETPNHNDKELKKLLQENEKAITQVIQKHIQQYMGYYQKYAKPNHIEAYKFNINKRNEILTDSLKLGETIKDASLFRYHNIWLRQSRQLDVDIQNSANDFLANLLTNQFFKNKLSELYHLETNSPYINFTAATLSGDTLELSKLLEQKKLVLLNFWTTNCKECIKDMPQLKKSYEKYKDQGLEILGLRLNISNSAKTSSIINTDMPWIHIIKDQDNSPEAIFKQYKMQYTPGNILIDANTGKIIGVNLKVETLIEKIKEMLGD